MYIMSNGDYRHFIIIIKHSRFVIGYITAYTTFTFAENENSMQHTICIILNLYLIIEREEAF